MRDETRAVEDCSREPNLQLCRLGGAYACWIDPSVFDGKHWHPFLDQRGDSLSDFAEKRASALPRLMHEVPADVIVFELEQRERVAIDFERDVGGIPQTSRILSFWHCARLNKAINKRCKRAEAK